MTFKYRNKKKQLKAKEIVAINLKFSNEELKNFFFIFLVVTLFKNNNN